MRIEPSDDLKDYRAPRLHDAFRILSDYEIAIVLLIVFGLLVGVDLWGRFG